jgi:hypothetical protein
MMPTLFFLLLRRYKKNHPEKFNALFTKAKYISRIMICLLVALLMVIGSFAQDKRLSYTVKKNGKDIGTLVFKETITGQRITHLMFSDIKVRFVLSIHAKGKEEAIYDNGILSFSRTFQKMNGEVETDNTTIKKNNSYLISSGSDSSILKTFPIYFSMASLYGTEPLQYKEVYFDKYKKLLPIQAIGPHHYKIVFPNGNNNEYFYNNGICTRIKVNAVLFNIEMILN